MKDLASSMKDLTEAATTQNVAAALPTYFQANRATAIFRIPDSDIDLRAKTSTILGPQVCFAEDDRFYVLHYTGLLYVSHYYPPCTMKCDTMLKEGNLRRLCSLLFHRYLDRSMCNLSLTNAANVQWPTLPHGSLRDRNSNSIDKKNLMR